MNLALEYELALVLLAVVAIAWFMGRVVCKSKENEVRSDLNSLKQHNSHLESIVTTRETELHALSEALHEAEKRTEEVQHQFEMSQAALQHADIKHKETLAQLESLNEYPVKLEQLQHQYDALNAKRFEMEDNETQSQETLQHKRDEIDQQKNQMREYENEIAALTDKMAREKEDFTAALDAKSEKIAELHEKINAYWQAANVTNSRISGMLKDLPRR